MQPLNLKTDKPTEFEGKSIELNNAQYTVGPQYRDSDQGFAHYLINQKSGLCQHLVQIRPEYQTESDLALKLSQVKAEQTATLRKEMRLKKPEVNISGISLVEAHEGCFELHDISWGSFSKNIGTPGVDTIREIFKDEKNTETETIVRKLESFLEEHPNHTEALTLLGNCIAANGSYYQAYEFVTRAIKIEPNVVRYRGEQLQYALNGGNRHTAMTAFEELQTLFPYYDDYNNEGIHAYLGCGEVEKAQALFKASRLDEHDHENLRKRIANAIVANDTYRKIEQRIINSRTKLDKQTETKIIAELRELLQQYPENPWVQMNLGLTLRNSGNPEEASNLLQQADGGLQLGLTPYCLMNTAFCLAELKKWDAAIAIFDSATKLLNLLTGSSISPADVPGYAKWIFSSGEILEHKSNAPETLITAAINHCTDKSLVTTHVSRLQSLFQEARIQLQQPKKEPEIQPSSHWAPHTTALTSLMLSMFAFFGAVAIFSVPMSLEGTIFGLLITAPVLFVIYISYKRYTQTKSTTYLALLVFIPLLAFTGGLSLAAYNALGSPLNFFSGKTNALNKHYSSCGIMDIYSPKGTKIFVTYRSAQTGTNSDRDSVRKFLEIGKLYTVEKTDVHSSHTRVTIQEIQGRTFNSVNFETPCRKDY